MAKNELFLTRAGYKKLQDELDHLKKVKRKELSKAIGEAIAEGDLKENAGYDTAKNLQGMNEARIRQVESILSWAKIIEDVKVNEAEICVGSYVHMVNIDTKDEVKYRLLSGAEADIDNDEISYESPVGVALMGHKEKDIVEIEVHAGKLKYKILKISREKC
ncbi:MAG: transcription elongation factor GreA [Elusimicrobia bacterium RIFOXYB2_FULL_48_7]|nr:MAG: transcription elongation factor GreA [Elusimicrobia bacterium RIFOXYB2_FULL_48_7]